MNRELGWAPHFDDVEPFPGAPRYFARTHDRGLETITTFEGSSPEAVLKGEATNVEVHHPFPPGTFLEIVGFAVHHKDDPHDAAIEAREFKHNKRFIAWCFSSIEPQGELGFVPLSDCREISRDELVKALRDLGHDVE